MTIGAVLNMSWNTSHALLIASTAILDHLVNHVLSTMLIMACLDVLTNSHLYSSCLD